MCGCFCSSYIPVAARGEACQELYLAKENRDFPLTFVVCCDSKSVTSEVIIIVSPIKSSLECVTQSVSQSVQHSYSGESFAQNSLTSCTLQRCYVCMPHYLPMQPSCMPVCRSAIFNQLLKSHCLKCLNNGY